MQGLYWLLDRDAHLTKETYTYYIGTGGKWHIDKSYLSSQLAKKPVWCYSPVDLLLCMRLPSCPAYTHVLHYPLCFRIVRALIDMGFHELLALGHRHIYRKTCKERGLSCREPVTIRSEHEMEELARGFELI